MIDPSIWTNEDFGNLTAFQQVLYIGLISNADDEGRIKGAPQYLKAVIFPYKSLRGSEIVEAMKILGKTLVICYSVNGQAYIFHPNWLNWQKIDRPYPSKLPPPGGHSPNIRRTFADHSPPKQNNTEQAKPKQQNTTQTKQIGDVASKGFKLLLSVGVGMDVASKLAATLLNRWLIAGTRYLILIRYCPPGKVVRMGIFGIVKNIYGT